MTETSPMSTAAPGIAAAPGTAGTPAQVGPPSSMSADVADASGITSRAMRRALLACWSLGTLLSIPSWSPDNLAGQVVCAVWLGVACLVVTARGARMPLLHAGLVALGPTVAGLALLAPLSSPPTTQMWAWQFAGNLLGLVAARGSRRVATVGFLSQTALLAVWVLAHRPATLTPAAVELLVACVPYAVGMVWFRILTTSLQAARSSDEATVRARMEAEAARAATLRGQELMDRVTAASAPLLGRLAAGDPSATGHECVVTEAAVRDLIRAPRLTAPPLATATARARDEGVAVTLLDDGEENTAIPPRVLTEAAGLVERSVRASATRILIRALPPGREDSMTFLADGMPGDAAVRQRWSFPG